MIKYEEKMRELIDKLNKATEEYELNHHTMSDQEWDTLYYTLLEYERKAGEVLSDSPTQKIHYTPVEKLEKKIHPFPMLSLQKSKDLKDIEEWAGDKKLVMMPKLDGLTCALTYENGFLVAAETRGDGFIGEDILHNAIVLDSIPKTIPRLEKTVIHGEIVVELYDFKQIAKEYKHPRSYAAGAIRLLDPNECAKRKIKFVAWDLVQPRAETFSDSLGLLYDWEFTVVDWWDNAKPNQNNIDAVVDNNVKEDYPIDGIVFRYNDYAEYDAAGATAHHYNGGYAYKFYDEEVTTYLRGFDWTMGTTGVLTPVAVFDPVEIDGTTVERASVHNISVLESIFGDPYEGQEIKVFKANQIIPQVKEAVKIPYGEVVAKGGVNFHYPERCPVCHGEVNVHVTKNGTAALMCENPLCEGKFLVNLTHFCGKKGLDIKGLSKATLKDLITWEWVSEYKDLYDLKKYRKLWISKNGYGQLSVDKILNAIEESKKQPLWRLISAINIPLVGENTAKLLADAFETYDVFVAAATGGYDFTKLPDIGYITSASIKAYDYEPINDLVNNYLSVEIAAQKSVPKAERILKGVNVCITGKLKHYKNRDSLKLDIEALGGKVVQTAGASTTVLVTNSTDATTTKYKAAKARNIPIVTEEEFIREWMEK